MSSLSIPTLHVVTYRMIPASDSVLKCNKDGTKPVVNAKVVGVYTTVAKAKKAAKEFFKANGKTFGQIDSCGLQYYWSDPNGKWDAEVVIDMHDLKGDNDSFSG